MSGNSLSKLSAVACLTLWLVVVYASSTIVTNVLVALGARPTFGQTGNGPAIWPELHFRRKRSRQPAYRA
jgi:hypothetical protein